MLLGRQNRKCMVMEGQLHLHSHAAATPCSHPLNQAPGPGKILLLSAMHCLLITQQQLLLEIYLKIRVGVLV
jgi:hypothetical protein